MYSPARPAAAGVIVGLAASALLLASSRHGPPWLADVWGFQPTPGSPHWGRALARTAAVTAAAGGLAVAVAALRGRARWVGLAACGVIAALPTLFGHLGNPSGDTLFNLLGHVQWDGPEDSHLFVGGEFLGHLWFTPWVAAQPDQQVRAALMAARVAGWVGMAGLGVLGVQLATRAAGRSAIEGGATLAAVCCVPYVVLLWGYPQSTALMSGLLPVALAAGVACARTSGERTAPRWLPAAAGVALALAVTAHGAAYFLGLGAIALLTRWIRAGRPLRALGFALGFAVVWLGVSAAERALIHHSDTMPWSFWARSFHWQGLRESLQGPIGLLGSSPYFAQGAAVGELRRWTLSMVPLAALAIPALLAAGALTTRTRLTGRPGPPPGRRPAEHSYLVASAAGAGLLWATWNVWYGYPADWDVTAIAALTMQLAVVSALDGSRWGALRVALLTGVLPVQVAAALQMGSRYVGLPP